MEQDRNERPYDQCDEIGLTGCVYEFGCYQPQGRQDGEIHGVRGEPAPESRVNQLGRVGDTGFSSSYVVLDTHSKFPSSRVQPPCLLSQL